MLQKIQSIERMVRWLYCKVKDSAVGGIQSIVQGDNITIDNTDPSNPVVSATGTATNPVSATQPGIVDNTPLQELGGVDKKINGITIGRGTGVLKIIIQQ